VITIISRAISACLDEPRKEDIKRLLRRWGIEYEDWVRVVEYRECFAFVRSLGPERLDALEISGGGRWKQLGFRSFLATDYPDYDVCERPLDRQFDVIIADQVFEHLLWPYRAARNVYAMLKPGGTFVIATPFLIKLHPMPYDCTRWSETGLKYLLAEAGWQLDNITTGSWGNRACVTANFGRWAKCAPWRSLKNERHFPVTVWAFARK
jgi:SAM-dependent methyltransferase